MSRFDYVVYDQDALNCSLRYKQLFMQIEELLESSISLHLPEREKAYWKAALLHSEISYAMVGKAIRDDQIARNGSAELQEGRGNE